MHSNLAENKPAPDVFPSSLRESGQKDLANTSGSGQPALALTEADSGMTSPTDDPALAQIWAQTQAVLQRQLTRATYASLIQETRLLPLRKDTYSIQVPNPTSRGGRSRG